MVAAGWDCADTLRMLPAIPHDCRVIVIEGIPGAGKTTLARQLEQGVEGRPVASFGESALLHGWKHAYLPGIHGLRVQLHQSVLDRIEAEPHDGALFVLTRFHLSHVLLGGDSTAVGYRHILERLAGLHAHVLVPVVPDDEIEARASHPDRDDWQWRAHLQRRMADTGCNDLRGLYGRYQAELLGLLEAQPLSYTTLPPLSP